MYGTPPVTNVNPSQRCLILLRHFTRFHFSHCNVWNYISFQFLHLPVDPSLRFSVNLPPTQLFSLGKMFGTTKVFKRRLHLPTSRICYPNDTAGLVLSHFPDPNNTDSFFSPVSCC